MLNNVEPYAKRGDIFWYASLFSPPAKVKIWGVLKSHKDKENYCYVFDILDSDDDELGVQEHIYHNEFQNHMYKSEEKAKEAWENAKKDTIKASVTIIYEAFKQIETERADLIETLLITNTEDLLDKVIEENFEPHEREQLKKIIYENIKKYRRQRK